MIRRIATAAVVLAAWSSTASAQQSRAELLRTASAAYDDFAPDRAIDLLKAAVNPALGPTDTSWVRGVHLLTQILIEGGNQELAKTWARWAARLSPNMSVDTVNFVAGVGSALREARAFTSGRTAGDVVTRTSWRWVARGSSERSGRVVVDPAGMPVAVNARVVGGGIVPTGVGLSLPPGSYEIEAAAPGYLPVRLSREVLPGVTTVLAFSLTSAAVASDVIAEPLRQHTYQNVAPLSVRRFGSAPSCVAATFMTRDGLLLTSYQAIRGADAISADPGANIRVAAYDVAADLVVLQLPTTRADSIVPATAIADGQSAWGMRFANCRTPSDVRVRVSQWVDRPVGALLLSDVPAEAVPGSPLVDVGGRLTGVWTGGTSATAAPKAVDLLAQARRNVAQGQLLTVAEVARRENHTYGSVVITTDLAGAMASVRPLESWQWAGLQSSGTTPFTFAGPMGRYRAQITGPGDVRREQDFTIRPGVQDRLAVVLRSVAAVPGAPTSIPAKKKSKKPWILAGLGGGVALVAAAAMGGGGGGGGGPPPPPPSTTGTITIGVPVNPP
jgi:hypothetical protein